MGTRHLTCVVTAGMFRVAQYGQWNGYLENTGTAILDFLRKWNRPVFETNLATVSVVSDEELEKMWCLAGAAPGTTSVSFGVASAFQSRYPSLSRDLGCAILPLIEKNTGVLVKPDIWFAAQSLFCEWAYVLDLDENRFEVYAGFNQTRLTSSDRFVFLEKHLLDKAEANPSGKCSDYHPVKLLAAFPLDALPSDEDFLKACGRVDNDSADES